jgi:Ser/Thr protein kinase RdoA (MazF antagonist)
MKQTYLAQVRSMRGVATIALERFMLPTASLEFINHGENTTFRVRAGSRSFLLRIHREGYHSLPALKEELEWLKRLAAVEGLLTPVPVRGLDGYLTFAGSLWCDLLEWVPGTFLRKRISFPRIFQLGALAATLQKHSDGQNCKHRRYWTAQGLVGVSGKFGAIDSLWGVDRKEQSKISAGRRLVFERLRDFERRFPARSGLIHADLHFGNFLVCGDQLGAIDFDDCGFGLHAYDLAVPLTQLENMFVSDWGHFLAHYNVLQEGYAKFGRWDSHDEAILPWLMTARRLVMLGWLQSRAGNPKLLKILPGAVDRAIEHMERFGVI